KEVLDPVTINYLPPKKYPTSTLTLTYLPREREIHRCRDGAKRTGRCCGRHSVLRVDIRRRRCLRLARQHFELGFDESRIAPAVIFLRKPTCANIAGAVDQELGMNVRDPDHSLLPVVEGAGKQAISGGYVLRAVIGVKNLASCKGPEGLTNLARRNQDDFRAERGQPLTGNQQLLKPRRVLRDGLLRAGKKHHEEGGLALIIAEKADFAIFIGHLEVRWPQPVPAGLDLGFDDARLVTNGKSTEKIDDVPAIVIGEHVAKRRHARRQNAVGYPPIEVAWSVQGRVRRRKIGGLYRQARSRGSVAMAAHAMAAGAIVFIVLETSSNRRHCVWNVCCEIGTWKSRHRDGGQRQGATGDEGGNADPK